MDHKREISLRKNLDKLRISLDPEEFGVDSKLSLKNTINDFIQKSQ